MWAETKRIEATLASFSAPQMEEQPGLLNQAELRMTSLESPSPMPTRESLWAAGWGHSSHNTTWFQEKETSQITNHFALGQNYPNPFHPTTIIEFSLPRSGSVRLKVFNVLGEVVAMLVDEELNVGTYTTQWNASGVASGVYFYRQQAGDPSAGSGQSFVDTKKLL